MLVSDGWKKEQAISSPSFKIQAESPLSARLTTRGMGSTGELLTTSLSLKNPDAPVIEPESSFKSSQPVKQGVTPQAHGPDETVSHTSKSVALVD